MMTALLLSILFCLRKNLDFTLLTYRQLLETLKECGYTFITFKQYCQTPVEQLPERFIILRHDVDLRAKNSLATAQIEHEFGLQASYYFRVVPESNQPDIIRKIVALGHEVGYHYEDMAIMSGDTEKALAHFQQQLAYFRQYYPISTICMHGAPTSQWDGRILWKHIDYREFGIIGEPYFDVDFSQVFYLTDTGRRWDGYKVSVRDKIPQYQDLWTEKGWVYRRSSQIIEAAKKTTLPSRIMITTHPQRWTNNPLLWIGEMLLQTAKNTIKRMFLVK